MDFPPVISRFLVTTIFSFLILILSIGSTSVYSAPIGVGSTAPVAKEINPQLNVSVQVDGPDSLSGQVRVSLSPSSHHLVNISRLWPMFVHAQANIEDPSAYFAVIGIHSHQRNVTFCERVGSGRYRPVLNGTNLGLVWKLGTSDQQLEQQLLCLYNAHSAPLNVQLRLNLYDNSHPIPGGCNIEFALENSPFIFVHRRSTPSSTTGPLIDYVEFQPAALGSQSPTGFALPSRLQCGQLSRARLRYEVYAHYGWDGQGSSEEEVEAQYFRSINLMSSRKWLQRHGTLIHQISHHYRPQASLALAPLSSSSTESPFLRLFIITSLNQQIYFNIVVIDDDDDAAVAAGQEHKQQLNSSSNNYHLYHHHHSTASLYVPSQITSHVFLTNYAQLFTSLSALSLFSLVVSIIGFRHFILELFYFTFLLTLGLLLCVGSRTLPPGLLVLQPGDISPWLLAICTVASLLVAAAWSEFCRRTRNLKCAFCGHSLVLAITTVAITGDVFISLPVTSTLLLGGAGAHYLYYIAVLSILLCHGLYLLYLDYFWLSALSSSFATVYFLLLPLDLYLFSGILFRILFQLFLVLTQFSAAASTATTTVTFINFSSRDVFLLVLFTLLVSGSVYWQLISKLASKGYGFGCMAPMAAKSANMSSVSSIVANLKLQVQPLSKIDQEIVKLKVVVDESVRNQGAAKTQSSKKTKTWRAKKRQKRSKLALSLNCGCTGTGSNSGGNSSKSRSKSNSPCSSFRSQAASTKTKLYRCKHCQKYSTTRFSSTSKKLRNSCAKLRV